MSYIKLDNDDIVSAYFDEILIKAFGSGVTMSLRKPYQINSSDLRNILGVSPPRLSELIIKEGLEYTNKNAPRGKLRNLSGMDARKLLKARGYAYPKRCRKMAMLMCKGGVGKTTTSYLVSQRLSAYGARVLCIDADPQGNLTSAFSLDQYEMDLDEETPILLDAITGECTLRDTIITITDNLHLVPSTPMNSVLESRIRESFKNPSKPIAALLRDEQIEDDYDYILFDCAPALNLTNTAVTCASDEAILPVNPDKFSQIGLNQTLSEIEQIEEEFGLAIKKRILFTRYDAREMTSIKYLAEIASKHEDQQFGTAIRVSADVKNVITKQEYLFALRRSHAKEDYDSLTREILEINGQLKKLRKNA